MTTLEQHETAEEPGDYSDTYSVAHKQEAASIEDMPLAWIEPSPLNPRQHFDEAALAELAASIRTHGLLEALVVRQLYRDNAEDPVYVLIAGERRFRAAQLAGLETVPARVLSGVDERKHRELALLENLQRVDLDPLEEAAGYAGLAELGYTQGQIAAAVHRSQPSVAKAIGLLRLPDDVQELIRTGALSATHGVALARYAAFPPVCSQMAALVVQNGLTTGQIEREKVPFSYQLRQAGAIKSLDSYETHFDVDICKSRCPHGAYRVPGGFGGGYCLRPDHYDELQAEADRAEKERIARAQAEAKAAEAGTGEPGPRAPIPTLESLKTVQSLSGHKPPSGCTPQCRCRAQALNRDGQAIPICSDPARYAKLQELDRRTAAKTKRNEATERREKLEAALAALPQTGYGRRELAVLVATILQHRSARKPVRALCEALVPGLGATMERYDVVTQALPLLAAQDALTLIRVGLTAELHGELLDEYGSRPLYTWYVDNAPEKAGETAQRIEQLRAGLPETDDPTERYAIMQELRALLSGSGQPLPPDVEAETAEPAARRRPR